MAEKNIDHMRDGYQAAAELFGVGTDKLRTHIEVGPDGHGGWKVEAHWSPPPGVGTDGAHLSRVISRPRFKRSAVIVGRALAKTHHLELRIKNRHGQYTADAASYGNDPRRSAG